MFGGSANNTRNPTINLFNQETLEQKYLRLENSTDGFSSDTSECFEIYLLIKDKAKGRCLALIEQELMSLIEKEVEAYVFNSIK
ncbi:MAG: hypothetical protein COB24_04400 [Hyphomicrobiales bacterium]|nr:MAG: hypothetical protein COB24_04400 [Hyphomicrobiales bacterium]